VTVECGLTVKGAGRMCIVTECLGLSVVVVVVVVVVVIIIIISSSSISSSSIIISFMQSIYTYIPETNYVPREYSVAAILLLLFMVLISLVSVLNHHHHHHHHHLLYAGYLYLYP
jgi:uncharacterized BrkB/YihY/UPF0761 family membrane protein